MLTRSNSDRIFLASLVVVLLFAPAAVAIQIQSQIPGGGYTIAGMVVSKADRHPLARARILVRDVKNSKNIYTAITSEDGKFAFAGLAAGKYSLEGAKRGFISGAYDQHDQYSTAIVTGAGIDTESLALRLAPAAIIGGVVLDEVGEPVRQATVTVYYDDHRSGVSRIHAFSSAQTNDLGAFEITPLLPGTYFLSVKAKPWYAVHVGSQPTGQPAPPTSVDRSLDVAYPVTYYSDVTEADAATPIPVRGGDHVHVNVHMGPVPALSLFFRISRDGAGGYVMPQLQQPAFDEAVAVEPGFASNISEDKVEISGIPAGRYNILLSSQNGEGMQMKGVALSNDQEVDLSGGEVLAKVKISAQILGESALPPNLAVALRLWRSVGMIRHLFDAKGEAELEQVQPGLNEVLILSPAKPYAIARISAEGAQVLGHAIDVKAGTTPVVKLVVVGGTATVEGIAKRSGRAVAGAMIVLVPKNPELNRDAFRRDQSDLDGTFSLPGVIPGTYTIVAIEDGWDLDWSQPGVISAYLKHGRNIEVGAQSGLSMNVAEPIEVQPK